MGTSAHEFAVDFAQAVTVRSSYEYDWVARRGKNSIYQLILDLAPTVSFHTKSRIQLVTKYCREQALEFSNDYG
jgi:hypothetical protein